MLIRSGFVLLLSLMPILLNAADIGADARSSAASDRKPSAVNFSARYKSLSTERAYQLQKAYVRNRVAHGVTMVGFKAAITSEDTQKQFGVSAPITGVLIEPPLQGSNIVVPLAQAYTLMLEQELAFRVSQAISNKVDTVDDLKTYFDAIAPAIELPDLNFIGSDFTVLDIIANNAMVHKLIVGQWRKPNRNLDNIATSLYCDDKLVINQTSSKVLEGQWSTLLWMVNHVIAQGYTIRPGQILLTGAINGMHEAKSCNYSADFGPLGIIRFVVR